MSQIKTLIVLLSLLSINSARATDLVAPLPTTGDNAATQSPTAPAAVDPASTATAKTNAEADAADVEKKLREFQQMQQMQHKSNILQMLAQGLSGFGGGGGASSSSGTSDEIRNSPGRGYRGHSADLPPSDCKAKPDAKMFSDFRACKAGKGNSMEGRRAILVDTDKHVGYQLDPDGNILRCFRVTTGPSIGLGGNAPGDRQTEVGFFYQQNHGSSTSKYATQARDYERKGIGMGIPGGKVFHSDHNYRSNTATHGCIGVEKAKWHDVFNAFQPGDVAYVWSAKLNRCTGSPGSSGSPKTYPSRGTR